GAARRGGVGARSGGVATGCRGTVAPPIGPGLGWAVAGALIGGAPAVFDLMVAASSGLGMRGAWRKMLNGLLGGGAGGFLRGVVGGVAAPPCAKGVWGTASQPL